MVMLAAILAVAIPISLFSERVPAPIACASTFPEIVIRKAGSQHEWPFSIEEGELTCVRVGAQRAVFFSEILTPEEMGGFGNMTLPRMVVVTANPLAYMVSFEDRELYAPYDTLETLITRLAPFERMGWALCDAAETAPQADTKS